MVFGVLLPEKACCILFVFTSPFLAPGYIYHKLRNSSGQWLMKTLFILVSFFFLTCNEYHDVEYLEFLLIYKIRKSMSNSFFFYMLHYINKHFKYFFLKCISRSRLLISPRKCLLLVTNNFLDLLCSHEQMGHQCPSIHTCTHSSKHWASEEEKTSY